MWGGWAVSAWGGQDLHGYAEEVADDTILFYATYKPESHRAGVDVWDLIRFGTEDSRYRTWQIKAGPKVVKLCQVHEVRTSSDNVFIEGMHDPATLAALPTPLPVAPRAVTDTIADFPILQRHVGTWEGTFTFLDPDTGTAVDTHRCKLEIGHQGGLYAQRNTYTWEDGRQAPRRR